MSGHDVETARDVDESRRRHNFFFPDGAPDVAITGLVVNRATIREIDPGKKRGPDETDVRWAVQGALSPEGMVPDTIIVGDLTARHGSWVAGCTSVAHLEFRTPDLRPKPGDDEQLRAYAAWASSALYDFCSTQIRHMTAGALYASIEIPWLTPVAELDSLKVNVAPIESNDSHGDGNPEKKVTMELETGV